MCSTVDKDVSPGLSLGMMIETYMDVVCKCHLSQASQCRSPGVAILFVCCMLPVTLHLVCTNALQRKRSHCCVQHHSLLCACCQVLQVEAAARGALPAKPALHKPLKWPAKLLPDNSLKFRYIMLLC